MSMEWEPREKKTYDIECPRCGRTVDAMKGGNCECGQNIDDID